MSAPTSRKALRSCLATGELREWIKANMPALHAQLLPLSMLESLQVLNKASGLRIRADDGIDETAPQILAALKRKHHNKGNHEST